MAARWPDEVKMWSKVAEAARVQREAEAKVLARAIRNEMAEALG